MRKFTLLLSLFLAINVLQAQDYQISFEGSNSETIESIIVKNLTQGTEKTLVGGDILHLLGTTTGVEQVINQSEGLRVYPNPMTENSSIEFEASVSGLASISVFDITGKQVISEQRDLSVGTHVFKLNNLSTGIYTLSVKSDSYLYSSKLVSQSVKTGNASLSYESKTALKSTKSAKATTATVEMQYNVDDRLLITATTDDSKSTVKSVVYTATGTEIFAFYACTDGDGTHYPSVTIGNQVWMAENLNTTKYSDGTAIPYYSKDQNAEFAALGDNDTDKGFGYYDVAGNEAGEIYGALYTYAAATNGDNSGTNVQGACPTGWHLPSDIEWTTLTDELGGVNVAGGKLKATTLWNDPNIGATNESGFTGLPAGFRYYNNGGFGSLGNYGYFWSATQDFNYAWERLLSYDSSDVSRNSNRKSFGFPVRCLRD